MLLLISITLYITLKAPQCNLITFALNCKIDFKEIKRKKITLKVYSHKVTIYSFLCWGSGCDSHSASACDLQNLVPHICRILGSPNRDWTWITTVKVPSPNKWTARKFPKITIFDTLFIFLKIWSSIWYYFPLVL